MDIEDPSSSPPRTPPPRSPSIPQTPSSAGRVNRTPSRVNFPASSPSFRKRRRSQVQRNVDASITREQRATPSVSTPMRNVRRRTIALNASDVTRVLADSGRASEAFYRRRSSFLRTPAKDNSIPPQHVQESPSDILQALAKMLAPSANPPPPTALPDHLNTNTPVRTPRTPRRSLNNRKLSGFLPGTPRRSSFRNTAFAGQTYRGRSIRRDVETPARVSRLADIRTPSDVLRLLTRMPDFQKNPSPTPTSSKPEHRLSDLPFQGIDSKNRLPETPSDRESILPNMSLLEMHEQFQLLSDDEKTFVRDSLEFGFRHHRYRKGLMSSDDLEKQRRQTYNSDATFGDSMWEDEEDVMDDEMITEEDVAISTTHQDVANRRGSYRRQSNQSAQEDDEIDLTVPAEQNLSYLKERRSLHNVQEHSSPAADQLEQDDDMPLDFGPDDDMEENYEAEEDANDQGGQENLATKQARLSQLGFAPIDTLEDKFNDTQISSSSRPKLQPQSPVPPPERPPVQVTLAQLAARNATDNDPLRRDVKAPTQKVSEAGVVVPNLPKALIRDLFSSFAKTKVSREAMETVIEASHQFFAQASEDLSVYASHAGRTLIQENDVQCLMRRQRILNGKVTIEALAHKYLPRELWDEICVSALANNELHPKRQPQ